MATRKTRLDSIRADVIARDNGRCRACGLHDPENLHADHVVPESLGGKPTLDNLQALCGHCNTRKGTTFVGSLPVWPPLPEWDCGNLTTIRHCRKLFQDMLVRARQEQRESIKATILSWKRQGVRGVVIRNRVRKMPGLQQCQADAILRETR